MTDLDPKIKTAFEAVSLDPTKRTAMLAQAEVPRSGWSNWAVGLAVAATLLLVGIPASVPLLHRLDVGAAFGLAKAKPAVTSVEIHDFDGFVQVGDEVEVIALVDRASGMKNIGFATVRDRQGSKVWLEGASEDISRIAGEWRAPLTRLVVVHGEQREMAILPDPIGTPDLARATRTGSASLYTTRDGITSKALRNVPITFVDQGVVGVIVSKGATVRLLQTASQGTTNLVAEEEEMRVVVVDVPGPDLNHGIQHTARLFLVDAERAIELGTFRMEPTTAGDARLWVPVETAQRIMSSSLKARLASADFGSGTSTVALSTVCAGLKDVRIRYHGREVGTGTCYDIDDAAMVTVSAEEVASLLMLDEGGLVLEPR